MAQPTAAREVSASTQDWEAMLRQRVSAQDFPGALGVTEARLQQVPSDLEARGWRARILGWLGRWPESETEYRRVLERAPKDVDMLNGLGRTLRAQGRRAEAREMFGAALAIDPLSAEAREGLASLRESPRHKLAVNADTDQFNFTPEDARAVLGAVRSEWTPRWATEFGTRYDHRASLPATRVSGAVTRKLPARSALSVGASIGRDHGIVAKADVFADYGRGLVFAHDSFVRGAEVNILVRRLWFDGADVATITPGVLLYLPREWTLQVNVTAARSTYPELGTEWRPSGVTRVTFPLNERLIGHAFFAAGTENYALADQIGAFSARTVGGGMRVHLSPRREITGYIAYQTRDRQRTQTSVGIGYALRF